LVGWAPSTDGSEAGTGTFWQEKLDQVTGPPAALFDKIAAGWPTV
jgi:hypothetical protein